MSLLWWLLLCLVEPARAGMIHGVAVENTSSRPLARTKVRLQSVAGSGLRSFAEAMANRGGQFWFPSLPDGRYVLSATRAGFAQAIYGQKRHGGSAQLIEVKGDSTTFAELRLLKLGAISGRVIDENRVALAGINVIAYHATLPLRQVTSAKTDDRGIFRLFGLTPGRYYVRSSAHDLEDGVGLLPTFFPGNTGTQDARLVRTTLDAEVTDIDFQPLPGKLLWVGGIASGCPTGERFVKVTLSSDTGRREL